MAAGISPPNATTVVAAMAPKPMYTPARSPNKIIEATDAVAFFAIMLSNSWAISLPDRSSTFTRTDPVQNICSQLTGGNRTHHIHMVEAHFEHWDRLLFRNYLIEHPQVARKYGSLKQRLSNSHAHDRVTYTEAKTDFVVRVTRIAREYYENAQLGCATGEAD